MFKKMSWLSIVVVMILLLSQTAFGDRVYDTLDKYSFAWLEVNPDGWCIEINTINSDDGFYATSLRLVVSVLHADGTINPKGTGKIEVKIARGMWTDVRYHNYAVVYGDGSVEDPVVFQLNRGINGGGRIYIFVRPVGGLIGWHIKTSVTCNLWRLNGDGSVDNVGPRKGAPALLLAGTITEQEQPKDVDKGEPDGNGKILLEVTDKRINTFDIGREKITVTVPDGKVYDIRESTIRIAGVRPVVLKETSMETYIEVLEQELLLEWVIPYVDKGKIETRTAHFTGEWNDGEEFDIPISYTIFSATTEDEEPEPEPEETDPAIYGYFSDGDRLYEADCEGMEFTFEPITLTAMSEPQEVVFDDSISYQAIAKISQVTLSTGIDICLSLVPIYGEYMDLEVVLCSEEPFDRTLAGVSFIWGCSTVITPNIGGPYNKLKRNIGEIVEALARHNTLMLGLNRHIGPYAASTGSKVLSDWLMVSDALGGKVWHALKDTFHRVEKIEFLLDWKDGYPLDISKLVGAEKIIDGAPAQGWTMMELDIIRREPDLLKKTTFIFDGKPVEITQEMLYEASLPLGKNVK